MAAVTPKDHEKFCLIDGWEPLKGARGQGRDHRYYRKQLADGRVLRTKISHNNKSYPAGLWNKIWKRELALDNQEMFFDALKNGIRPEREMTSDPIIEKQGIEKAEIPDWLQIQLRQTMGLNREQMATLTADRAAEYWEYYCAVGAAPPVISSLSRVKTLEEVKSQQLEPSQMSL